MSQFSFPLLSEREICHSLGELGMNIGPDHFAKASYELVQPVYENLVSVLMGVSREELQQPVFAAIGTLEFPELHDESIPALAFITHLGKLLAASGIKDFSLRDLHKPDGPRLRRNLSAIINFAKFREEKLIAYAELQEHFQSLLTGREEAEAENAQLQAELDALQKDAAAELPEVERLTAEADAVYAENAALNRQQAVLSGEVRTLKQGANALTDEAAGLRLRLTSARGEESLLRGQVVQSPQKVAAALAALAAALESERGAVADAERRSRDTTARSDAVTRLEKEVSKALTLMAGVEAEIGVKKEVSHAVKALRGTIAASEHEAGQLAATLAHFRRQATTLEERIQRLEAQCEVKRGAAEGNIEEQLRDKEAYEAENAANAAKLAQNEAAIRTLRQRLADITEAHETQRAAVLERYAGLLQQVRSYHAELALAMQGEGSKPATGGTERVHAAVSIR